MFSELILCEVLYRLQLQLNWLYSLLLQDSNNKILKSWINELGSYISEKKQQAESLYFIVFDNGWIAKDSKPQSIPAPDGYLYFRDWRKKLLSKYLQNNCINNMSSTAIIYKKSDPRKIFIEIKDNTHPIVLARGGLCFIGGNWTGDAAIDDLGPRGTVCRELIEELTLIGKEVNTEELVNLGLVEKSENYTVQKPKVEPTESDQVMLANLVSIITAGLEPFGSYLNTVTKKAMLSNDPNSTREEFTTLCCYYSIGLDEKEWQDLEYLQEKYGNLSNESITTILTIEYILERDFSGAFCHEQVLQAFFLANNITEAEQMRIIPDQTSIFAGLPFETYEKYLEMYEIMKKPV